MKVVITSLSAIRLCSTIGTFSHRLSLELIQSAIMASGVSSSIVGDYPWNGMLHKDSNSNIQKQIVPTQKYIIYVKKLFLAHLQSILRCLSLTCWTPPLITQHSLSNHLDPSIVVHHIHNIICRVPMEHGVCVLGMTITFRQLAIFLKKTQSGSLNVN